LGAGADIVKASDGADIVSGGGGNDTLFGQAGTDTLTGGAGRDRLIGGADADTFVFIRGGGIDVVFDYLDGTDKLDVSDFGFSSFAANIAPRIDTVNGKAIIDLAFGDRVVLTGVNAGDLDASDFILS
jgi:serralysin